RRAEIMLMGGHDPLARFARQADRYADRSEQIANLAVLLQIQADAAPQVVERTRTPVGRRNETAAQLQPGVETPGQFRRVIEQTGAVQAAQAAFGHDACPAAKTVRAD